MPKSILQIINTSCVQKTARRNTKYSKNKTILKIGYHANAIAHAKSSHLVKNLNSKKHVKIHSSNHIKIFCAKNSSKKHEIFEKWDHSQNCPSCKGYSPCKILTLGQKLKFQKTCQNPFYKQFTLVVCKKPLKKKHQIFDKWEHFENQPLCKGYSPCKILTLSKKIKIQKNMLKSLLQIIYRCSAQKTARKNTKYSRNESILKIAHHAKAIAHAKSSLWVKN